MPAEIVGFEDVIEELRRRIMEEHKERDVISIVGMPGLGKTTLADKLYLDESISSRFDILAKCCVSQVYKRKDLLLSILHEANRATGERYDCSTAAEAADKLQKTLKLKRYLILVDDVWEASAWDDLSSCFYDANNGSRIILTTRNLEVAKHASISTPILLRMLNDNESWKLLQDRVFGKECCSPHLEEIGQQIAKKCGGLPLSIVLVAGILAKMEKKEESWKEVATTLGSKIHSDSKAIVEKSYQDLPFHLKPCFLYLGAFLEDRVIDASTLTSLWISEAFIKCFDGKLLEDIAQGYLENLIGRNLVMVSKRAYFDGKVKACRIHDVLLEFCKKRATEENFLLWAERDQDVNPSSHIYSFRKHDTQPRFAFREVETLVKWSSSCSLVGSLIFRQSTAQELRISDISQNFKFLKVLDLDLYIVMDSFPMYLVHLRYLSERTAQRSIPSSISNLRNLKTLILKDENGYESLPITLWDMVKLRQLHLCFSGSFVRASAKRLNPDTPTLNDLVILSYPSFSRVGDAELMFTNAPNLQELKCNFAGASSSSSSDQFPVLDFPTRLEKLCIFPEGSKRMFPVCVSASNLKDLRVRGFRMTTQHLSSIGQLEKLQAVRLDSIKFGDEKWEVSDHEFSQLKVLKLMNCTGLNEWTVADDAFPNLERLTLCKCIDLKDIPSSFEEISSLKSVKVKFCYESVVESARTIRDTQVDVYQNNAFKLSITGPNLEKQGTE